MCYLLRLRVEGVLYVALPNDAQMSDDLDSDSAQHVVLAVSERLRGSHYDTLSCVNTWKGVIYSA